MKLNSTTDHAIRILVLLAKSGDRLQSTYLSDEINLSRRYLYKIAARLRKAKLLCVTKGPEGGYSLASVPAEISLYDIIEALEGPMQLPDHVEESKHGNALGSVYLYFQGFFCRFTKMITLDILALYSDEELKQLANDFVTTEKARLFM